MSEWRHIARKVFRLICPRLLSLAVVHTIVAAASLTAAATPTIVIGQGLLKGISMPAEDQYLGIPYARPPVGELRWRPPLPPSHFKGLFEATEFPNACAQTDGAGGLFGSEDCLYLNVYVPKGPVPPHGFPVMVWIHGGGLVTGASFEFDPTRLVEGGNVIVVTINYRLGYFGFFAHPALDSEHHLAGNYGLLDQQLALFWVHWNIESFAGNPKQVTIFGESAGGLSVYSNLASPTAAGLFQAAISESGAYNTFAGHFPFTDYLANIVSLKTAETTGSSGFGQVPSGIAAANALGCTSLTSAACLRAVSALELVSVEPSAVFPFIDGTVLTEPPGEALGSGDSTAYQLFRDLTMTNGGTSSL